MSPTSCAATGKSWPRRNHHNAHAKQVWGDEFGMCVDAFGVSWMVNISQPQT